MCNGVRCVPTAWRKLRWFQTCVSLVFSTLFSPCDMFCACDVPQPLEHQPIHNCTWRCLSVPLTHSSKETCEFFHAVGTHVECLSFFRTRATLYKNKLCCAAEPMLNTQRHHCFARGSITLYLPSSRNDKPRAAPERLE